MTDPLLIAAYANAQESKDARKQLHASLALLPVDSGQVEYLYGRLLKAEPQEVIVIREMLQRHKHDLTEPLWSVLRNPKNDQDERFRAACALALFTPEDSRWNNVNEDVAARLVNQNAFVLGKWAEALEPVSKFMLPPLALFIEDERRNRAELSVIAGLYKRFAKAQPDAFARLEKVMNEQSKTGISAEEKIALAKRQANVGVVLVAMGEGDKVWLHLKMSPDPTFRSFLMERLAPGGVNPKVLFARFAEEHESSVRQAILLSLGDFGIDRLSQGERQQFLPRLIELYRDDVDPGIHGAAEWLLRKWQADEKIKEVAGKLTTGRVEGKRLWYINTEGQTMAVIPEPGEVWIEKAKVNAFGIGRSRAQIDHSFAIAFKEVTVDQFRKLMSRNPSLKHVSPTGECPVTSVGWYDAVEYCNKLSEKEGIERSEWCYLPNKAGKYDDGMQIAQNLIRKTGYRLPTEAEWEFACRAGSTKMFSFGESDELLVKYGWYGLNAASVTHPTGLLKPNGFGLFDMHGNAWEWCQNTFISNKNNDLFVLSKDGRVLRGGSYFNQASLVRLSFRLHGAPTFNNFDNGFRVARTMPLNPPP